MESRINYTIVGLFVFLLVTGLVAFVFWLAKYGTQQEYDQYLVYMSESVAGLSADASVKYKGVSVGNVGRISLKPDNTEEVELLLDIRQDVPIKTDTRAQIKSTGITGIAFIELTGSSNDAPLLKQSADTPPVIEASPSIFAQIDESSRQLVEKTNLAFAKFDRLFSEKNLQNIEAILRETNMLAGDIRSQLAGFDEVVANGVILEKRAIAAFEQVETAAGSVKKMASSLEKTYVDVGRNMGRNVQQSFDSFNQLLYDLDLAVLGLHDTIEAIRASPNDLLFKSSLPRPGPGEKGYDEK